MFDLSTVETNHGAQYLEPGVHTVKVVEAKGETPDDKADNISVTFEAASGESTVQRFYMSERAAKNSLINIKHLVATIAGEQAANGIAGTDVPTLGESINAAIAGKDCKIKLSGEYYNGSLRAKFGFRPFVSAADQDILKFNPESDIKKDEAASMTEGIAMPSAAPGAGAPAGDLQFG